MNKHMRIGMALIAGLTVFGCDRNKDVEEQVQDLKEAQQNSPEVANKLQGELDNAKSEVARLEEKVALAKQGITDEVVEERNELKDALKHQETNVREEVKEAQGAAAEHNADSQKAVPALEKSRQTEQVQARVKTETTRVPTGAGVEVQREQQQVPIENTKVMEKTGAAQDAPATTTSTTVEHR